MNLPEKHDYPGELYILSGRDRQYLKRLIGVPWTVYAGDRSRVPQLLRVMDAVRSPAAAQGIEEVEMSRVREDNSRQPIIRTFGGDPY
jgi:hypothetical protein